MLSWPQRLLPVVLGGGVAAFAYGVLVERRAYRLRRVSLPLLAPGSPPWRLLHLTDLHLTQRDRRLVAWVRRLGEEHPDLVVLTGDAVAEARALPDLARALDPLRSCPGVFVFGSNDRYRPIAKPPWAYFAGRRRRPTGDRLLPTAALDALLSSWGWHNVQERRLVLDLPGGPVEIRGTGDAHIGRDHYDRVAGPPDRRARLALGVTHAPYRRLLDAMTADGVDLIVAGHTHGGQVCLPGFGALTTNCDLDRRRAKGLSWWSVGSRRAALHVSAGLGTSPYAPYRFACPPEATLITLLPADPTA